MSFGCNAFAFNPMREPSSDPTSSWVRARRYRDSKRSLLPSLRHREITGIKITRVNQLLRERRIRFIQLVNASPEFRFHVLLGFAGDDCHLVSYRVKEDGYYFVIWRYKETSGPTAELTVIYETKIFPSEDPENHHAHLDISVWLSADEKLFVLQGISLTNQVSLAVIPSPIQFPSNRVLCLHLISQGPSSPRYEFDTFERGGEYLCAVRTSSEEVWLIRFKIEEFVSPQPSTVGPFHIHGVSSRNDSGKFAARMTVSSIFDPDSFFPRMAERDPILRKHSPDDCESSLLKYLEPSDEFVVYVQSEHSREGSEPFFCGFLITYSFDTERSRVLKKTFQASSRTVSSSNACSFKRLLGAHFSRQSRQAKHMLRWTNQPVLMGVSQHHLSHPSLPFSILFD